MSQRKHPSSSEEPLNKRGSSQANATVDDSAWNDRLAAARAQREALLAQKAQQPEAENKKKLKPWERAEMAAAERRKQREEAGVVTRKAPEPAIKVAEVDRSAHAAAALSVATETPLVLEAATPAAVTQDEKPRDRRIWAVAAVFLIGLGAGFVVAAPDRIAAGFQNLQVLLGNEPDPVLPQDTAATRPVAGSSEDAASPIADSQRPSDVALTDVALGQAAFRIGPPEPFTERSSAPQEVAKAFFGDKTTPRLLASDRIARPLQGVAVSAQGAPGPVGASLAVGDMLAPPEPAVSGNFAQVDDEAGFQRYAPFQPATPGAEISLAGDSLRAPSTAFGVEPPLTAADVANTVQLSSFMAPELPAASGILVGDALPLAGRTRTTVEALLAPQSPDQLDVGETPIKLAALTEGSRLDFEDPLFATAVVPSARDDDLKFQRTSAWLVSAPETPTAVPPVAGLPRVETWAALPDLDAGSGESQPVQLAALWSDESVLQVESILARPGDASAFAPSQAVIDPYQAVDAPRFPGLDVLVWAPRATPDERVADVEATLRDEGFVIEPANRLDIRITQDQVRYFQPSSAEAAAILAQSIGARLRDFTNFRPAPPDGTIEVWLRGEEAAPAPQTRVVRAPRPPRQTQAQREQQQLLQLRNRLIQTLRQNDF